MPWKKHITTFLLVTGILVFLSGCGEGLCSGSCPSSSEVGISGVTTRPNADGTMDVGISGTGFESGATVTISGVNCSNVTVVSSTYLTCTLPNQTTPIVDIVITNPSGGSSGGGSGGSGGGSSYHTIFVTSTESGGDLGGLTGADSTCQTRAVAGTKTSTLTGTWRAILSSDATNAKDRISFVLGSSIKNTNLEAVLSLSSTFWSGGSLSAAIQYDENGTLVTSITRVWTATNANGTKVTLGGASDDRNCLNWTTNGAVKVGYLGDLSATSSNWIYTGAAGECKSTSSAKSHLYCINSNN